jgi:dinuclear metal center YbgI/SA1388 family protein
MAAQVGKILEWLDAYYPFRFAESWDNCGLLVGDPGDPVEKILVALDVGSDVLAEAQLLRCQCIVTHHPLLFQPIRAVRADVFPGNLVIGAIRNGINLVAAHTNLDAAVGGTNDALSDRLSLREARPLEVDPAMAGARSYGGMGRLGRLDREMSLDELAGWLGGILGGIPVRMVGDPRMRVQTTALCTGSGSSLMKQALAAGARAFVTGDLKYHDAQWAVEAGLGVIDVGHFASERLIVEPLAARLRKCSEDEGFQTDVVVSNQERDPFQARGPSFREQSKETHLA